MSDTVKNAGARREPKPGRRGVAALTPASPVRVEAPTGGVILRTPRMVLRPMVEADRAELVRIVRLSRAELERFSPLHRGGETDDQLVARQLAASELMTHSDEAAGPTFRRVGVLEDGRIAGCFNLNGISRGLTFQADANWWIASDAAGRGLATEGVGALVEHALADLPDGLGLHAVRAWITRGHAASARIAEKLGFRATVDQSYLQAGSRWTMHDLYVRSVA